MQAEETYIRERQKRPVKERPIQREGGINEGRNKDVKTKCTLEERYAGRRDLHI